MTGKALQKGIIELARRRGWRVAHFPAVRDHTGYWRTAVAADGRGFPDLLLVRDRVVAAEVKGDGDRLRADQEQWITAFRLARVETYLWTPKDWSAGIIDEILTLRIP